MGEFDSICGYASVKRELEQIADFLCRPDRYEKLGARMPAGLLIDGKPGLGKTLMASCLIEASSLQAFTCRKTKSGDSMLKAIRKVFAQAAESAPAIVSHYLSGKSCSLDVPARDVSDLVEGHSCAFLERDISR